MLKETFCAVCTRTVYRGAEENDVCPVCSSPLMTAVAEVSVPAGKPSSNPIIPDDEELRLAAVRRYDILDSPPDGSFDRVASLAARIFDVPIATISIVDADRIWFKATHGLDATQIARKPGLCASAILQYEPWVVSDAAVDPRTLTNPLVRGELGLRFYAGVPLTTADKLNLGTLNIIDVSPRELSEDQIETLKELAEIVVDELELRLAALRLARVAEAQGVPLRT